MQIAKNKTMAALIALFLISAMAISLVALPAANAQAPAGYKTKKTYAVIGAVPNPVGVGQEVLIWVGITDMLRIYTDGWSGLTVTVTRPDNTTETLGPFRTDAIGSTGTTYVPTMVGTYYLQTHFPAQGYNWTVPASFDPHLFGPIWYEASSSSKLALIVQQEPIKYYPGSPLPTEYWTRPIDAQHREWSKIAGNWLAGLATAFTRTTYDFFAPYTTGPETAHILWTKPIGVHGGLAGGELDPHSYEHGGAYEGKWWPPVIINGMLYYNQFEFRGDIAVEQRVVAVDLRTGEECWSKVLLNNSRIAFGQLFYWDSFNYHGVFAYLWVTRTVAGVTTWSAFDAATGRWVYNITGVPSGFGVRGPNGEIYIYTIDLARRWMTLWNSSRTVARSVPLGSGQGSWRPHGMTYPATDGIEWNKTIPTGLPGSVRVVFTDRVIGSDAWGWTGMGDRPITTWGISLKPGQEGLLLFNRSWQPPLGDLTISWGAASLEDGVFTMSCKETRQWWGFSLDTGAQIWGPTKSQDLLGIYGMNGVIAYGKLFSSGYGGVVYCYDVKTGALLWNYTAADPYNEASQSIGLMGNWPIFPAFIADGKIYMYHTEHSPMNPLPRDAPFICLNATTGELIWSIPFYQSSWAQNPAIADGIIVNLNSYDNRIYAFGKGPSATTVEAPLTAIPLGSSVVIRGMVTDASAGTKDSALAARFPNGVPAVADESMSEWMKYVYMQFPRPMDAVGVEVVVSVLDSNNNFYEVGRTTSDATGFFSHAFTPEVPGKYTIITTFAGSGAYYGSFAETAIYVEEAPPATPPPTYPVPIDYTLSIVGTGIAIIIAVAIATILILRKRP